MDYDDDDNGRDHQSLPASELALLASLAVVVPPVADQISGRRQAGVATICAALLACGGAAMLQSGGEWFFRIEGVVLGMKTVGGGGSYCRRKSGCLQFFVGLSTSRNIHR